MEAISYLQDPNTIDDRVLPTDDEVAQYEKLGWYQTQQIIPHGLLEQARQAIMEHQMGKRDRALPRDAKFSDWRPEDGDGIRNNEFCSLQNDIVRKLVMLPALGAIAARLARSSTIRLFDDQAVYKPPVGKGNTVSVVGWHTDHSYWSTCTSSRMLTAWIPFEDANEENGTLCVVDGSHLWPEVEHMRGFNDPDLGSIEKHLGRQIPTSIVSPMRLRKGQVSFHHMRALHASAANWTDTPRLALAIHMQDGDNSYRSYKTENDDRVILPHDELCRRNRKGDPDYADPEVFPIIWPTQVKSVPHG